jgi:hypothetical protein
MAVNLANVLNSIAGVLGNVPASTVTTITGSIVDLVNGNQAQEKNLVVQMEAFMYTNPKMVDHLLQSFLAIQNLPASLLNFASSINALTDTGLPAKILQLQQMVDNPNG